MTTRTTVRTPTPQRHRVGKPPTIGACAMHGCTASSRYDALCTAHLAASRRHLRTELTALRAQHGALLSTMRTIRRLLRTNADLGDYRHAEPWRKALIRALLALDELDPPGV